MAEPVDKIQLTVHHSNMNPEHVRDTVTEALRDLFLDMSVTVDMKVFPRQTRDVTDYRALLEQVKAAADEEVVVWDAPVSKQARSKASAVASALSSWIRLPHRSANGRVACHAEHCDPVHHGLGKAWTRTVEGRVRVQAVWFGNEHGDDDHRSGNTHT
jgi:hypothetical protein